MKLQKYLSYILVLIIIGFIALYIPTEKNNPQKSTNIKTIRVAGDMNYPPYEFLDANGLYRGFNVDIMSSIAIELGINIEFVPMTWDESIKALQEGKVDAIQGITETEYRKAFFKFSKPIATNYQVIFVRKDTTYISGMEDLVNRSVAVQSGDINEEIMKVMPDIKVIYKDDQEDGIKALISGDVDAFIGNRLVGLYTIQKNNITEQVKIVGQPMSMAEYCSATLKGNEEVLNVLNEGIDRIKENGTYDKIYKKWFGEAFVDQSSFWRQILLIVLVTFGFMLIVFITIVLINKKLKNMVAARTEELTEVNNKLRESEENYRRLFEISPDAVFIHNREKLLFSNGGALKLVGAKDINEIIDRPIIDFLMQDDIKKYRQLIDNLNEDEATLTLEAEKVKKLDGTYVDVEIRVTPYFGKNETIMISIVRDLTDKKLLDEAIEYDKLKTEFFANISHEFRTPLNVTLSTIQLLEMYMKNGILESEEKLTKYVSTMKQNSYRLLRLVNNLIDITKIDSGFYKTELKNNNIVSLVEDITLSIAEYSENRGINLIFDTDVEEKIIACDPDKIERIILNLLSNAIKFTPRGGNITVNIFDRKERVVITVKDTGIGIPENKIGVVFERFRQVDKSLARSHEGSGIGLSLVKSLVEMHSGKISLNSKLGKGSEFIIELPANISSIKEELPASYIDEGSVERINIEFSDIYSQ